MKKYLPSSLGRKIAHSLWLMLAVIVISSVSASCDREEDSELEEASGKKPSQGQTATKSDLFSQKDLNEAMRAYFPHRDFVEKEFVPSEDDPVNTSYDNDYCFLPLDATIDNANNIFYGWVSTDHSNYHLFSITGDDFDWSAWFMMKQDYAYPIATKGTTLYLNSPTYRLYTIQILCDHDGIVSDISQVSSRDISVCHTSLKEMKKSSTHRIEFGSNNTDSPKIWILVMKYATQFETDENGVLDFGPNVVLRFAQMPSDPNFDFRVKDYYLRNPEAYYDKYIDWDRQNDWFFNTDDEYPSIH